MITNVEIVDNKNLPNEYIQGLDNFKNGTIYKFKPGTNIIIGSNGCGKTTLLNLISRYTLCYDSLVSEVPGELLEMYDMFDDNHRLKDGAKVRSDYKGGVFKYLPKTELNRMPSTSILKSFENASIYASSGSMGESMMEGMAILINKMFNGDPHRFPIKELEKKAERSNSHWKLNLQSLLQYYKENKDTSNEFEYTVLLDEPDRNLDIDNISELYGVLSYRKQGVQLIAVIHNPMLIYKLSKIEEINFIEMSEGYLNKIIDFIENKTLG